MEKGSGPGHVGKMIETGVQIRFADVDMLCHVNNVNLQHYFDLGKGDFFRDILGISSMAGSVGLITAGTSTSYLEQTRYEDDIFVETGVEKVGTKSLTMFQKIVNRTTGAVHAESRSAMVAYDFVRQESIPVPEEWREIFRSEGFV